MDIKHYYMVFLLLYGIPLIILKILIDFFNFEEIKSFAGWLLAIMLVKLILASFIWIFKGQGSIWKRLSISIGVILMLPLILWVHFNYINSHGVANNAFKNKNYNKAEKYYIKSCNKGIAKSCTEVSGMYESGKYIKKDMHKYILYANRACDQGSFESCLSLYIEYKHGINLPKNLSRKEYYARRCYEVDKHNARIYLSN